MNNAPDIHILDFVPFDYTCTTDLSIMPNDRVVFTFVDAPNTCLTCTYVESVAVVCDDHDDVYHAFDTDDNVRAYVRDHDVDAVYIMRVHNGNTVLFADPMNFAR